MQEARHGVGDSDKDELVTPEEAVEQLIQLDDAQPGADDGQTEDGNLAHP